MRLPCERPQANARVPACRCARRGQALCSGCAERESADHAIQVIRQLAQAGDALRRALHGPVGLLSHASDLRRGAGQFVARHRLCARCLGNVADQRGDARHLALDAEYVAVRRVDQAADLDRRLGRPLGQLPDFVGNNGETAPRFTGPRRLDGGIECQQVGLVGDFAYFLCVLYVSAISASKEVSTEVLRLIDIFCHGHKKTPVTQHLLGNRGADFQSAAAIRPSRSPPLP